MNKLVMNFLITEGYVEAAEKFRMESGTEPDIDLATITYRMAVKNGSTKCDEEEKGGEIVVSKVFYQTQPRQCGSLMKDSSAPPGKHMKGQSVHAEVMNNNKNNNNNGYVEYYHSSNFISFDQGGQNARVISHFPVHEGAPFIP
ncbi:Protein GID8 [Glycine max]|nr:Protein GID8 [Glycine max]